jgi:hypothetical protein
MVSCAETCLTYFADVLTVVHLYIVACAVYAHCNTGWQLSCTHTE